MGFRDGDGDGDGVTSARIVGIGVVSMIFCPFSVFDEHEHVC